MSISALTEKLLSEHNILIKNLEKKYIFEGKKFMRLAIVEPENNDLLVDAMREIVEGK